MNHQNSIQLRFTRFNNWYLGWNSANDCKLMKRRGQSIASSPSSLPLIFSQLPAVLSKHYHVSSRQNDIQHGYLVNNQLPFFSYTTERTIRAVNYSILLMAQSFQLIAIVLGADNPIIRPRTFIPCAVLWLIWRHRMFSLCTYNICDNKETDFHSGSNSTGYKCNLFDLHRQTGQHLQILFWKPFFGQLKPPKSVLSSSLTNIS